MYLLSIKLIYISKIRLNIILLKKNLFLDIWAGPSFLKKITALLFIYY
jgi:hypothetical protein